MLSIKPVYITLQMNNFFRIWHALKVKKSRANIQNMTTRSELGVSRPLKAYNYVDHDRLIGERLPIGRGSVGDWLTTVSGGYIYDDKKSTNVWRLVGNRSATGWRPGGV